MGYKFGMNGESQGRKGWLDSLASLMVDGVYKYSFGVQEI